MKRFILVENNIVINVVMLDVIAPSTVPVNFFSCAIFDPKEVFNVGDTYNENIYLSAYKDTNLLEHATTSQESIFMFTPYFNFKPSFLSKVGLVINTNPQVRSKYVYSLRDNLGIFNFLTAYGEKHSVKTPDYLLSNKEVAQEKYRTAGFETLVSVLIKSRNDLVQFPFDRVILKPSISCGSLTLNLILRDACYIIRDKTDMLLLLDSLNVFDDPSILENTPIIAQQVADSNEENFEALILSGAVNGSGDIWHLAPIELFQQYNDSGRNAKTVWSSENNTVETAQLQQCVERLLVNAGSINCFYQLQFLRSNGAWVPHDFQYRMTYYVDSGLDQLGFEQYKVDIVKFAFNQSTQKTDQPRTFGLKLLAPRVGRELKQFIEGESKAEVLATLESL